MSNNVFHLPLHTDQKTKMDASRQTFVVLALLEYKPHIKSGILHR